MTQDATPLEKLAPPFPTQASPWAFPSPIPLPALFLRWFLILHLFFVVFPSSHPFIRAKKLIWISCMKPPLNSHVKSPQLHQFPQTLCLSTISCTMIFFKFTPHFAARVIRFPECFPPPGFFKCSRHLFLFFLQSLFRLPPAQNPSRNHFLADMSEECPGDVPACYCKIFFAPSFSSIKVQFEDALRSGGTLLHPATETDPSRRQVPFIVLLFPNFRNSLDFFPFQGKKTLSAPDDTRRE